MVNGDGVPSKSLDHIKSYPVIKDTMNSSLGQRVLGLADQGYQTFFVPFQPYLEKPYSLVHPYVKAADGYADAGLTKFENTVPQIKEPTGSLKDSFFGLVFLPLHLAGTSRDYVIKTYSDQYEKCGGDKGGLVSPVKAILSTGLTVSSDVFGSAAEFLGAKKEQAKETAKKGANMVKEKTGTK